MVTYHWMRESPLEWLKMSQYLGNPDIWSLGWEYGRF